MKWELFGTGLALVGIGLGLMLTLPPPWWPRMPPWLINSGILAGLVLTVIGLAVAVIGVWPALQGKRLGPAFLILIGALFLLAGAAWYYFASYSETTNAKPETETNQLTFVFPNECNADNKVSLFKRSHGFVLEREPSQIITVHQFFIGLRNPSETRTLRNARIIIEAIEGAQPASPYNFPLICEETGSARVDIPPKKMEYFLLGTVTDNSEKGAYSLKFVLRKQYDDLLTQMKSSSHVGFFLVSSKSKLKLLRNNGYILELTAYAEDCLPITKTMTVNARDKIEILLNA